MPDRPKLGDPGAPARIRSGGQAERGTPVVRHHGGEGKGAWSAAVIPIFAAGVGAGGIGQSLLGGRSKPRAIFEVRCEYVGPGLPEFGDVGESQRIESFNTEDLELAKAVAGAAAELLRGGCRDILLPRLAEDAKGKQ